MKHTKAHSKAVIGKLMKSRYSYNNTFQDLQVQLLL